MGRTCISLNRHTNIKLGILIIAASALMSACGGHLNESSGTTTSQNQQLTCDDSLKTAFKPDAETSVIAVRAFAKGDAFPNAVSDGSTVAGADLCLVKLLVGPGNPGPAGAPSTSAGIGVEVWLPAKTVWNGRLHAIGGGGFAGTEETDPTLISSGTEGSDERSAPTIAAQEGAVTATTDTGHRSLGAADLAAYDGSFAMNPDGTPNTTLWNDFSSRAIHEEVVEAKALATAYYGSAPRRTYWDGGSTGGRQGLKQAQLYPDDFDGIIAGYPAINWTKFITAELYPQIVIQQDLVTAGQAAPTAAQLDLVSNAAISACDMEGGKHLGFILDPSQCRYDPVKDTSVLCAASGGSNTTSSCVSSAQAKAIDKIWYGMTADGSVPDPAVDNGWDSTPSGTRRWYGLARGTELSALAGTVPFPIASTQVALELQNPTIAQPAFLNASGNGANGWAALSYADLSNAFDRGVALQNVFANINTDNPDLSAFKAHGGKLLQYHGLADIVIFANGSIDYYNKVIAQMGGLSNVQSFYRLYLVPGMSHGPGNGTSNASANPPYPATGQMYDLLTDWVENGKSPDSVTMTSASSTPEQKSLPMCAYPQKITYNAGDAFQASSYSCQ